jgi:hypothetical protein
MPESSDFGNTEKGCYTDHGVSGYGVAVRLTSKQALTEKQVRDLAEDMMMSIAVKCMDLGAKAIGHIKSHIRTECGTVKADTIGTSHGTYSSGSLAHPVKDLYVAINSIVQGIPEHAVKAATLEGIHEIADQNNIVVMKEKEHTYFDQFDFLMSKEEHQQQLEDQFQAVEEKD